MMKDMLETRLAQLKGHVGLYYKNLTTGKEIALFRGQAFGQEDRFEPASVIKIPIMIEAFRQMRDGVISADTKIVLEDGHKVPSPVMPHYETERREGRIAGGELFPESGILNYMHSGMEVTVMDLCVLMIVISDNTATNMLIDFLGKDNINATLRDLGCTVTTVNRKLFEIPADGCPPDCRENYVSLRELASLLEAMYRGELISPEASRQMTAILTNQQLNSKIPFYINHLPIAHKTGEDSGITNDVGIIYGEAPFLLCLCSNETHVPETERAWQDLAQLLLDYTQESNHTNG